MKYELGNVIRAQGVELIYLGECKGKKVLLKSVKDKGEYYTIKKEQFDYDVIRTDTSIATKLKAVKKMCKGDIFIGQDGKKYTLTQVLGSDINYTDGSYIYKNYVDFINNILDEKDEAVKYEVMTTLKEFNKLSNEDVMKIAVNTLKVHMGESNLKILSFGSKVVGEGYDHELHKYYKTIGCLIQYEYQFDFMDNKKKKISYCAAVVSRVPRSVPIVFDAVVNDCFESATNSRLEDGFGNHMDILEIKSCSEVMQKHGKDIL